MLNEFGKKVRKARIDADVSMNQMALDLETSASFLSAIETGRKKIPTEWVRVIEKYFKDKGVSVPGLGAAADLSNNSVSLDGLSREHQMLVAGFARVQSSSLTAEDVMKFKGFLQQIEGARK